MAPRPSRWHSDPPRVTGHSAPPRPATGTGVAPPAAVSDAVWPRPPDGHAVQHRRAHWRCPGHAHALCQRRGAGLPRAPAVPDCPGLLREGRRASWGTRTGQGDPLFLTRSRHCPPNGQTTRGRVWGRPGAQRPRRVRPPHGPRQLQGREGVKLHAAPLTPPPDLTCTSPPRCSHKVPAGPRHRGPWAAAGALHTVQGALSSGSPTPSPSRQLWAQAVQVGMDVRPAAGRRDLWPAGRAPALEPGAPTLSTAPTRGVTVQDR